MSFQKSLSVIRSKFPTWTIRYGFEFKEKFYFFGTPGKNRFDPRDTAVAVFIVNPKDNNIETKSFIETCFSFSLSEQKRFLKASENPTLIDISNEQYQKLLSL